MKLPQWKRQCHRQSSWSRWRWRWPCCRRCSSPGRWGWERGWGCGRWGARAVTISMKYAWIISCISWYDCLRKYEMWLLWKNSHLSTEPPLGLPARLGAFCGRHYLSGRVNTKLCNNQQHSDVANTDHAYDGLRYEKGQKAQKIQI